MISLTGMILKMALLRCGGNRLRGEGHLYLARDMELGNYWAVKELPISKNGKQSFCVCWNILLFQGWWTILRQKKPATL